MPYPPGVAQFCSAHPLAALLIIASVVALLGIVLFVWIASAAMRRSHQKREARRLYIQQFHEGEDRAACWRVAQGPKSVVHTLKEDQTHVENPSRS